MPISKSKEAIHPENIERMLGFRYCAYSVGVRTLRTQQPMSYQRTGRPTGRPRMPKDLKRQTVEVLLPPATVEAMEDLGHRGAYPNRTAFIERGAARTASAERRRSAPER